LLDFPNIVIKGSELQLPFQACLKVRLGPACLVLILLLMLACEREQPHLQLVA